MPNSRRFLIIKETATARVLINYAIYVYVLCRHQKIVMRSKSGSRIFRNGIFLQIDETILFLFRGINTYHLLMLFLLPGFMLLMNYTVKESAIFIESKPC